MSFVREFVIIESEMTAGNKIIPDTSLVMAFRYQGVVRAGATLAAAGAAPTGTTILPVTAITGLRKSSRLMYYAKGSANLLVILNEGGITAFSRTPAHELFDHSIPAENIFHPEALREILEKLSEALSNRQRIDRIETFLLKNHIDRKADLLIGSAVELIKQHSGIVRIKDLAASLHLSQDPFEKRFRAAIGSTPKQYASIIRLRSLIKKYSTHDSLTAAAYEAGYFDQSHFIKDFRLFTGQTPKDFFQSPLYW